MKTAKSDNTEKFYDKAAEAAVLGSMIIDDRCIPEVMLRVSEQAFFLPEHQAIYEALQCLYFEKNQRIGTSDKHQKIDAVLLRSQLVKMGQLENNSALDQAGGVEYLKKIMESVPHAANAVFYANKVREKQKEREVITIGSEIHEIANSPGDPDEKIQEIQTKALQLEPFRNEERFVRFADQATDVAMTLQERNPNLIQTGFWSIDRILVGLAPGDMAIVASRPSMGKTSLGLNIALNVAQTGRAVLFFSLEMGIKSILERTLCILAMVDQTKAREGDGLENEQKDALYYQALEARDKQLPLIFSNMGYTPAHQLNLIRQQKQMLDLGLVLIDYVQLMSPQQQQKDLRHTLTEVSKQLKQIAINEKVPLMVLSQLSRKPEERKDHKPIMSDLRESGSLEQDADVVLLLHREDYYHKAKANYEETKLCQIIIDKNRCGQTGVAELVFVPEYTRFAEKSNMVEEK